MRLEVGGVEIIPDIGWDVMGVGPVSDIKIQLADLLLHDVSHQYNTIPQLVNFG